MSLTSRPAGEGHRARGARSAAERVPVRPAARDGQADPPPEVEQPPPRAPPPELREPLRLHRPSAFPLRATGPWIALTAVAGVALIGGGVSVQSPQRAA